MKTLIRKKIKEYKWRYYSPGSPLQHIRKLYVRASNPLEHFKRVRKASELSAGLNQESRAIVDTLRHTGYSPAGSEIDSALRDEIARIANERLNAGSGESLRSFFTTVHKPEDLHSDNILVRFALQESVLKIVSAYFHEVPYLASLQILVSHGSGKTEWEESQLWHQDYADNKTLKLWIYLTDVSDISSGPFTYLPAETSKKVKNGIFPGRVSDESMNGQGFGKEAKEVYGKPLSTFYIDTGRCYHLGSRLKEGHVRVAYVATYLSHATFYQCNSGIKIDADATPLDKMVLTE